MKIPRIKDSKTGKYLKKKIEEGKEKISSIREKPCPCHYFTGQHFVAKDCDLDENGRCAACGQRFNAEGEPITIKAFFRKTIHKHAFEISFFSLKTES